jgi:hypothetical protein
MPRTAELPLPSVWLGCCELTLEVHPTAWCCPSSCWYVGVQTVVSELSMMVQPPPTM